MSSKSIARVLIAGLFAVCTSSAHGQQTTAGTDDVAQKITIRALGAFLGQVEGFCEDPGGTYDWLKTTPPQRPLAGCHPDNKTSRGSKWLGGVLGAQQMLAGSNGPNDWVIIPGNNETPKPGALSFWSRLADLHADVVAMGPEDFFRSVRAPHGSARALIAWVRGAANIPLLASNVAITDRGDGINTIEFEDDDFEFHLDRDATVGWTASLKVEHPEGLEIKADLHEFARSPGRIERGTAVPVEFEPGKKGADGTVSFPDGLRPGSWYRLVLLAGGSARASVVFETDAALTPAKLENERLTGFPVRINGTGNVMAVSLVDPDTKTGAGEAAWRWEEGGRTRELIFTDPAKTLKAMRNRGTSTRTGPIEITRPPVIILASTLSDDQTLDVLDAFADIRFVVLHPESRLLARASPEGKRATSTGIGAEEGRFSGDLGFASTVDVEFPEVTKIFVRPEWFGETLITASAQMDPLHDRWEIKQPKTSVRVVPGETLEWSIAANQVQYSANNILIDSAPLYLDCEPEAPGECRAFRELWTEKGQLPSLVGDALRSRMHADLAVASADLVDTDYGAYIGHVLKKQRSGLLSRYILERLVYQSPRIVKATVAGSALAETLKKIVDEDDSSCIAGVAGSCPTSIATDHPERLRVNERNINPRLFYTIAMPDWLAEKLKLPHDDEENFVDLVDAADDYLLRGRWRTGTEAGSLPRRLEAREAARWEGYLAVPALDFGLTRLRLHDPDGRTAVRKNLGLEFSGAEETTTISVAVEADLAVIDTPRWAVRLPSSLRLTERRESDERTYEGDEFSTGIRFDWKYKLARPYVGYFWDGQVVDHTTTLTASRPLDDSVRDGFNRSETAGFTTSYNVRARRFRQRAVGLDIVEIPKFEAGPRLTLGLKRFGVRVGDGTQTSVPVALTIGGEPQEIDRLLGEGEKALLNAYFADHPDTFTKDTAISLETGAVDQQRAQGDLEGDVKLKAFGTTFTTEVKLRHRWYDSPNAGQSPFQLSSDTRLELKLVVPLWGRLNLAPGYIFQQATIEDDENDEFRYHRFELKVSLPFVARWGRQWLLR